MAFVFQQLSEHGASHPVVARLQLQTFELLKMTSFDQSRREAIFQVYMEAAFRLLRCCETSRSLSEEAERQVARHSAASRMLPSVVGLDGQVERFLYEGKDYLRDLTGALNAAFDAKLEDAGDFWSRNSNPSKAARWADEKFGAASTLSRVLKAHSEWIAEAVKRRNAIQHPGGKSGKLHIRNFHLNSASELREPVWFRNEQPPSPLLKDLHDACQNLLHFGEEMLAGVVETSLAAPILALYEVPPERMAAERGFRFVVSLKPDFELPSPRL